VRNAFLVTFLFGIVFLLLSGSTIAAVLYQVYFIDCRLKLKII